MNTASQTFPILNPEPEISQEVSDSLCAEGSAEHLLEITLGPRQWEKKGERG